MNTNLKVGLEGAFKVDLYSGGKLVSTTDWFNNFITDTGLHMVKDYAFADCFRYLSIGNGVTVNKSSDGGTIATTGLASPFGTFLTNQGKQSGQWIDWRGYEVGSDSPSSACGTYLTSTGPRFFRAWNIPTGDSSVVVQEAGGALNISEFMVSPGHELDFTGKYAFSRIRRSLSIPNGYKALVSYQLKIVFSQTGASSFGLNTFDTTNADTSEDPTNFVTAWSNLYGKYRPVYHGLRCVDNKGHSFIPKYGDLMEPSATNLSQLSFYFSPDNSEFEVNNIDGGAVTSEISAYNSDGLMKFISSDQIPNATLSRDLTAITTQEDLSGFYYSPTAAQLFDSSFPGDEVVTPKNIRLGGPATPNLPSIKNYKVDNTWTNPTEVFNYQETQTDAFSESISFATPGNQQYQAIGGDEHPRIKAVFSSKFLRNPPTAIDYSGPNVRSSATITRKCSFSPNNSMGYNGRFASMVLAYCVNPSASEGDRNYYPYLDCLFKDASGASTLSNSRLQHYRWISGIVLTQRGTGICNAHFSIVDQWGNVPNTIERFNNIQTVQGGVTGSNTEHSELGPFSYSGNERYFVQALNSATHSTGTLGDMVRQITDASGAGYGYGGILMLNGPAYSPATFDPWPSTQMDCALIDRGNGGQTIPSNFDSLNTNTRPLYWPHTGAAGAKLQIRWDSIRFYDNATAKTYGWANGCNGTAYVPTGLAGGGVASSGFCVPTGYVVHFESSGTSEGDSYSRTHFARLLPHGAFPNKDDVYDRETRLQGGLYPALGFDNGIEMNLTLTWTSPCGDASNCT